MQKLATKVFIWSSVTFGVIGILLILSLPVGKGEDGSPNVVLFKLLWVNVFVILPSFALSVAGKYLNGKR
jgi:hypothetical protein